MAEPALTPVTSPEDASTVATPVSSEDHSPPESPSEVMVVVFPVVIVVVPDNDPAEGFVTVAVKSADPVQPREFVTFTVNISVVELEADGDAIDASSRSPEGDQEYVYVILEEVTVKASEDSNSASVPSQDEEPSVLEPSLGEEPPLFMTVAPP